MRKFVANSLIIRVVLFLIVIRWFSLLWSFNHLRNYSDLSIYSTAARSCYKNKVLNCVLVSQMLSDVVVSRTNVVFVVPQVISDMHSSKPQFKVSHHCITMGPIETPAALWSALSSHTEAPLAPDQGSCLRSSVSVAQRSHNNSRIVLKTHLWITVQLLRFHAGCVSDLIHVLDVVSRSGFENASKSFVVKDLDVSMVGRSFMITGANSGIGKATAMAIAKNGLFYSYTNDF